MTDEEIEKLRNSKYFCILPWVHARIETTGRVSPCCRVLNDFNYGNIQDKPLEELWNSKAARNMRLGLLRNEPLRQCEGCHKVEGPTHPLSFRQGNNAKFDHAFDRIKETKVDGSYETCELLFLDIRFSNICNFKCRMCHPHYSTGWYSDYNFITGGNNQWKEVIRPTINREDIWKVLDNQIPHVRQIYFAGGEPLIEEDHYLLLEKLISLGRTDTLLSYNTNLSTLKFQDWNVLDLWAKFGKVKLGVSLDGVGKQAELLRKGTRWSVIEENFDLARTVVPHENITIFPTVSVMNVFHLPVAVKKWLSLGWIKDDTNFKLNILEKPDHLNINILSDDERTRLRVLYDGLFSHMMTYYPRPLAKSIHKQFEVVWKVLKSKNGDTHRRKFREWTRVLDGIRGENFDDLFPELRDL